MNNGMRVGLVVLCLSAAACGAADDPEGTDMSAAPLAEEASILGAVQSAPSASVDEAREVELANVEANGERYTFLELGEGDDATLAMRVQGSIANGSALDGLLEREGELTFLEIFRALAPESDPPAALVRSHPIEVATMNRTDIRVRTVDKSFPPPGVNVCADENFYFAPLTWTNRSSAGAASGGDVYVCVSDVGAANGQAGEGQPSPTTCTFATTLRKMAGICNRGTVTMSSFSGFGSATTWSTTSSVTATPGEYTRWDLAASATTKRLAVVGISSFGGGAAYGLRAGTAL